MDFIARAIGRTKVGRNVRELQTPPDQIGLVDVGDVSGGMVLHVPRERLPGNSFVLAKNVRNRGEWVGRRNGTIAMEAPAPDGEPVASVLTYLDTSGNNYLIRVTMSGFYIYRHPGIWHRMGDGPASLRRPTHTQMFGRVFYASGSRLRMLDLARMRVTVLESPRLHYVTSFADRIVGARDGRSEIFWSANLEPRDWAAESAGRELLVQNTSDASDTITGVYGLGRELIILRRRSIWIGERQAQAIAPFRFSAMVDDIGCDMPYTVARVEGGLIFASYRLREVYFLAPGSRPQPIGDAVSRELFRGIRDLDWVEGSYDPREREYVLGVANEDRKIWRVWRFNARQGAWSFDDIPPVQSIGSVSTPHPLLAIDDLEGVIDDLEGTIDELGRAEEAARPLIYFGGPAGEVISYALGQVQRDVDWDDSPFEMVLESQDLGSPSKVRSFMDVLFRVAPHFPGSVEMELRGDGGWVGRGRAFTTETSLLRFPKPRVQGLALRWRLRSLEGALRLKGYSVRLREKGLARER